MCGGGAWAKCLECNKTTNVFSRDAQKDRFQNEGNLRKTRYEKNVLDHHPPTPHSTQKFAASIIQPPRDPDSGMWSLQGRSSFPTLSLRVPRKVDTDSSSRCRSFEVVGRKITKGGGGGILGVEHEMLRCRRPSKYPFLEANPSSLRGNLFYPLLCGRGEVARIEWIDHLRPVTHF